MNIYQSHMFLFCLQNISAKSLGSLVLDSIERSVDPLTKDIQVLRFLDNLLVSARDYERLLTENQIHSALRAVEVHTKTMQKIEEASWGSGDRCRQPTSASVGKAAVEPTYATVTKKSSR